MSAGPLMLLRRLSRRAVRQQAKGEEFVRPPFQNQAEGDSHQEPDSPHLALRITWPEH